MESYRGERRAVGAERVAKVPVLGEEEGRRKGRQRPWRGSAHRVVGAELAGLAVELGVKGGGEGGGRDG